MQKNVSRHRDNGKHSLNYDTIFKGKREVIDENSELYTYRKEDFEYDQTTMFYQESKNNTDYIQEKLLKDEIYKVLVSKTELDFTENRRKPAQKDFNIYFGLIIVELEHFHFTKCEMFVNLSEYFSDNYFNMFRLLNNEYRCLILDELQDHIGKTRSNNLVVNHRNLILNAEVEFKHFDPISEQEKLITGIIIDIIQTESKDSDTRKYKIDSFESIYLKDISFITKILNNTKFKYNMNKLDNIDFL